MVNETNDSFRNDSVHSGDSEHYIVRMRGLPWAVTVDEILKFYGKRNNVLFISSLYI